MAPVGSIILLVYLVGPLARSCGGTRPQAGESSSVAVADNARLGKQQDRSNAIRTAPGRKMQGEAQVNRTRGPETRKEEKERKEQEKRDRKEEADAAHETEKHDMVEAMHAARKKRIETTWEHGHSSDDGKRRHIRRHNGVDSCLPNDDAPYCRGVLEKECGSDCLPGEDDKYVVDSKGEFRQCEESDAHLGCDGGPVCKAKRFYCCFVCQQPGVSRDEHQPAKNESSEDRESEEEEAVGNPAEREDRFTTRAIYPKCKEGDVSDRSTVMMRSSCSNCHKLADLTCFQGWREKKDGGTVDHDKVFLLKEGTHDSSCAAMVQLDWPADYRALTGKQPRSHLKQDMMEAACPLFSQAEEVEASQDEELEGEEGYFAWLEKAKGRPKPELLKCDAANQDEDPDWDIGELPEAKPKGPVHRGDAVEEDERDEGEQDLGDFDEEEDEED